MRTLSDAEISRVSGGDKPSTFLVVAVGEGSAAIVTAPTNQAAHEMAKADKATISNAVKVVHDH